MTTTNRYERGKIYAIRSHLTDEIYVGSTCEPALARRLAQHRSDHKRFQRIGGSCPSSRFILQFGDAYIELLELFPCEFKDELTRREGEHIRNIGNCVNKRIEGRTLAEWKDDNRESLKTWHKQHYLDNRESIKIKSKQYYLYNNESIKAQKAQRIKCSYCNKSFARSDKAQHIKSIKHQTNYKISYLECFGEVFDGIIGIQDY
tara:strand:- start:56 stop:667 length:612 start_codon:yes stop_codon:yes gene_type:complete